ncbi:leucine-rich repeat receptor-like serine/threonine-protein kinase BAM2 [Momordica charantia]|uniref:Leucine-rich repeat receptor-like serine/threonine-protein kinase BAM2 n=1 Tax=Momordica charantia TaxID=3673 RepID=A0A6J1CWV2_MOMCH|nr:leucine-rich repeat receptor-like serine/threonine-protein kinase BAM2 [Momordica charantia]
MAMKSEKQKKAMGDFERMPMERGFGGREIATPSLRPLQISFLMRNLLFSWLLLMLHYSIFLSIGNYVVRGRCPEDQQSLLLELKNNLAYDSSLSKKLVLWNVSVDYCNWNGVSCDDGCVVGLDLSNEFISGAIDNSSSLFHLRFLQNLNLAWNRFDSTIPSRFERLSNLSVLNMSNSGFGGQIPIDISSLTRLVTLDLSSSSFFQSSTMKLENPNLMTLVQKLRNLRVLFLDGVDLSAGGSEWSKAKTPTCSRQCLNGSLRLVRLHHRNGLGLGIWMTRDVHTWANPLQDL